MKRIIRCALLGAVGFGGTGAVICLVEGSHAGPLSSFAIQGGIGGAMLGLALWDWKKVIGLALAGSIGFFIGFLALYMMSLWLMGFGESSSSPGWIESWGGVFFAFIPGAFGGASLGLVLMDYEALVSLTVAGALGFGVGMIMQGTVFGSGLFDSWLALGVEGVLGGAAVGAVLGYFAERKAMYSFG